MEITKIIPQQDYSALQSLVAEYLSEGDSILDICEKYPTTTVGYYFDTCLIGAAYGVASEFNDGFSLDGIAIIHPYNGVGRGGKLLAFFEKRVALLGYASISLGSAGGYVERFYLKNGYRAAELKILVPPGTTWKNHPAFPVVEVQEQGGYDKLVLAVADYFAMDKQELTRHYGGEESFFVFTKELL